MIYCNDFHNPMEPLKIELFYDYAEQSTKFTLLEEVVVSFEGKNFIIPTHSFVSDGASIPRMFWSICDPLNAQYIGAFLKHDAGYFYAPCSRKIIDDELLEDLKLCGMSFAKRQAIHKAVRMFGGKFYRGDKNED